LPDRVNLSTDVTDSFDACSSAVIVLDERANIIFVNDASTLLLGYSKSEVLKKNISVLIPTRFWVRHDAFLNSFYQASASTHAGQNQSFPAQHKNGELLHVRISLKPLFLHHQKFTVASVIEADLFNQVASSFAESQLRENSEILETTARFANLGFYSFDIHTNALSWSEEVYNIHDLALNQPICVEQAFTYYAPSARPVVINAFQECMKTGEPFDLELPFITEKKREIWVRAVGYLEFKKGKPVKLKGAIQDITYMRQAAIEANQAMRAKSAFLANMSHELRTPITGILGLANVLAEHASTEKQREYTQMIAQTAQALLYQVNQVLDFSKLEANKQALRYESFSLEQMFKETLYIHKLEAKKKHLGFYLELKDDVPQYFVCDQERLKQILHNLCSNALKFTDSGNITVRVENVDGRYLKFSIIDSGIGIAQDDQSKLFVAFQQLDTSFSRKFGGTGLGLTIVKQLVTLMNGKLGMLSDLNKGANFWFTLPLLKQKSRHIASKKQTELPQILMLVKDQHQQRIWQQCAKTCRAVVKPLMQLSEVLSTLKADHTWDIVVLMHAPSNIPLKTIIDSFQRLLSAEQHLCISTEVTEQKPERTAGKIEFFAIEEHGAASLEKVSEYLANVLNYYFKFAENTSNALQGKRLLLAEDKQINQIICKEMLSTTGIAITLVENGAEAVSLLETGKVFDIIIMDCQMPLLDGYQAAQMIKKHTTDSIRNHVIIAATAHGLEEDIQRCYDVGMIDVLVKPFTRKQLIEAIARNL
jgi:PAS domain S-box-containing protein